jgi:N-acetyl-1-D-myo-inositol-2-amino-2-deoxy-alpha-D-glucopyranoside deacetylase
MSTIDPRAGRPSGGLLAVHAHPDDETLSTGALLATWAAAGRPVTLVTCTRGEQGEVLGSAHARLAGDGSALGAYREGELAAALDALGVHDHGFLDRVGAPGARYVDSGMAWAEAGRAGRVDDLPPGAFVAADLDEAAGRLATVIRDRRPDVVVTYEPHGGYGHPDHVRAHEVTMRAVELAADPEWSGAAAGPVTVAAVLWAAQGITSLRAARAELADAPAVVGLRDEHPHLVLPGVGEALPSVAVPDDALDVLVDAGTVLPQVARALAAHATQVQAVTLLAVPQQRAGRRRASGATLAGTYALSNDVLVPLLSTEGYRFAPGSPVRDVDWPAGVRPVA